MNNLVKILNQGGQPVVTSRQIAGDFGKEHKTVLRSIDGLITQMNSAQNCAQCNSTQKCVQYFIPSEYKDDSGKANKEYLLTHDGFSLLVMGFTGQKAFEWKIKYIEAFNEATRQIQLGEFKPKATSVGEIASLIKILRASMKEQGSLSSEITEMEEMICQQFNVRLPKNFVRKPAFMQISLLLPLNERIEGR